MRAVNEITPGKLELVRIALVMGVLLFGVVAWFIHQGETSTKVAEMASIRWAIYAMMAMSLVTTIVLRSLIEKAPDYQRAASLTIIAWGITEAPALTGAAYLFLTGKAGLFVASTIVFVTALLVIGIPEERRRTG